MRGIAAPVSLNTLLSGDGVGKRGWHAKIRRASILPVAPDRAENRPYGGKSALAAIQA
ncbi:hypothetical protein [Mesorhizobium sp. B1-1-4]|uniref:hypothetical protein n=1 Tax=Mesorhizobium sp. B1-1-4 TaxID=2589980 RepID=UPI0015E3965B|nr:hypothetical protein [Mesorhizobium sp. B1-1-4]